ncbi:MAG: hypothetical protein FJ279_13850 [Planctomycetes bacterium]|nr:hypothetical protein [Planctomycetota bacterium]
MRCSGPNPCRHALRLLLVSFWSVTCWTAENNLLRNGGFEGEWQKAWKADSTVACWRHVRDGGRGGSAGMVVEVPPNIEAVQGVSFTSETVEVAEGHEVFFRVWYKAEKSLRGGTLLLFLRFQPTAKGAKRLDRDARFAVDTALQRDSEWHDLTFRMTVPAGYRSVVAAFGFWWVRSGKVAFDDAALWTEKPRHLPNALYKLDCGPADSDVFPGFTLLSADEKFGAGKPYGWDGKVAAHARYESQNPFKRPDPLAADLCYAEAATLKFELPAGKYGLALLVGDIGAGWGYSVLGRRTGYRIAVTGKVLAETPPMEWPEVYDKLLFATYRKPDWQPGEDVWDKYVTPCFTQYATTVEHKGGALSIDFRTCPVAMAVVYGPDGLKAMGAELAELDKVRRSMFPFRPFDPTPRPKEKLEPDEAEKARGYVVFSRDSLSPMYPTEAPSRDERREVKLFAAHGEYEAGSPVVGALRDLRGVSVRVGELRSESGAAFPARLIGLNYVRYIDTLVGVTYWPRPRIIQRLEKPLDVPAGTNRQFWLLFNVTKDVAAGTYKGVVTVESANARPVEIPITVRVLPIDLPPRVPDRWHCISTWNMYDAGYVGSEEKAWALYRAYLTCLKEHGQDTLFVGTGPWARPTAKWDGQRVTEVDVSWYEKVLSLYRELGFTENCLYVSWWPYTALVQDLAKGDEAAQAKILPQLLKAYDEVRARKFPEISAYYFAAVSDGWPFEQGMKVMKPYLDAGVTCYMQNIHLEDSLKWFPLVNLLLYSPHAPNGVAEVGALARKLNKPYGFSNVGFRVRDKACWNWWRFLWGWWFWRTGAQVQANEHYVFLYADPYNPFDGRGPERESVAFPTPGGVQPTLFMEWMRDGRDDHRYVALLESLTAKALASGNKEAVETAREAQDFLNRVREGIPLEARAFDFEEEIPGWSRDSFPRHAWFVAEKIMKLQGLLR